MWVQRTLRFVKPTFRILDTTAYTLMSITILLHTVVDRPHLQCNLLHCRSYDMTPPKILKKSFFTIKLHIHYL